MSRSIQLALSGFLVGSLFGKTLYGAEKGLPVAVLLAVAVMLSALLVLNPPIRK